MARPSESCCYQLAKSPPLPQSNTEAHLINVSMTNCVLSMCQIGWGFVCIRSASRFSFQELLRGASSPLSPTPLFPTHTHTLFTLLAHTKHRVARAPCQALRPPSLRGKDYFCQLHPAAQTFPSPQTLFYSARLYIILPVRVWVARVRKVKKKTLLFKWKRRKIKFNGLVVLSSPDLLLSLYHRLYSVSIKTSIKTQNCIQRNSAKECT